MPTKRFSVAAAILASVALLSACVQAPFEPVTRAEAKKVLSDLDTPSSIVKFNVEELRIEDGATPSDSFTSAFNVSERCESIARLGQLVYQAEWGTDNKQALPAGLRGFNVREGIRYTISTPDSADKSEYANLYVALLAFRDVEAADDFMSSISSNVQDCGDMKGELQEITRTGFEYLNGDEGDFRLEDVWRFTFLSVELTTFRMTGLYSMGSNVLAVHGSISQGGSAALGVSMDDLVVASDDVRDQMEALLKELQ